MEQKITDIISHIVNSQLQMAKILESERHIAVHFAQIMNNPRLSTIVLCTR
jgi:hypothetical protein